MEHQRPAQDRQEPEESRNRDLFPQFKFLPTTVGPPASTPPTAQTGNPNALQGFSRNRRQPGSQVVRGERLVMDVTTGVSHVEGGRIKSLFLPHSHSDRRGPTAQGKHLPKLAAPVPLAPN